MGLAEPRKRLKISHDPNNTAWSGSTTSYGQRLMLSQGWVAGQGLGAANRRGFNSYDNAKLKVSFKDDNLGLGASLKSRDVEASRTGLDAFQGLLGRLNGRSDAEVQEVERKVEERKLAMWAKGKWGGMVFVPGGLLVQREEFRRDEGVSVEQKELRALRNDAEAIKKAKERGKVIGDVEDVLTVGEDDAAAKARRKQERAEKRQRKEGRRRRRQKAENSAGVEMGSSNEVSAADPPKKKEKTKKNDSLPTPADDTSASSTDAAVDIHQVDPTPSRPTVRNGRQILRGKNIAAKKMAFADAKMLDEIFMRKS